MLCNILTSKCASRHNGVHFFDISTSKSGPNVVVCLTWECALRHNGVQLFISHLARWLRTRHFSEPTFRPCGATNHWKNHSVSRLSYLFAHLHLLSFVSFSSTLLSSNFSLLSDPFHLCFSSVHIVGSLTSKLPSVICILYTYYIHIVYILFFIYIIIFYFIIYIYIYIIHIHTYYIHIIYILYTYYIAILL